MEFERFFDWVLSIPQTIASFGTWVVSPINEQFLNISPIELLGVTGTATIITIIVLHVVRLFTI